MRRPDRGIGAGEIGRKRFDVFMANGGGPRGYIAPFANALRAWRTKREIGRILFNPIHVHLVGASGNACDGPSVVRRRGRTPGKRRGCDGS